MKVSVLIPSYKRPKDLERCLNSLKDQKKAPCEVVVVARDNDKETWKLLNNCDQKKLQTKKVYVPGTVAALNLGLDSIQGDIVAITDQDAVPHADWLQLIERYFKSDPLLGGLGGRDFVYDKGKLESGAEAVVGKLQWFGRAIGNHHIGCGPAREVDFLKGVNMAFRREAIQNIRFDRQLLGNRKVHYEIDFNLKLKKQGWKIIYDPKIAVDHYPDARKTSLNDIKNEVYNETLILLKHLTAFQRPIFLFWAVLVGTRAAPGVLQTLRFLSRERTTALRKLLASLRGRHEGLKTWFNSKN